MCHVFVITSAAIVRSGKGKNFAFRVIEIEEEFINSFARSHSLLSEAWSLKAVKTLMNDSRVILAILFFI